MFLYIFWQYKTYNNIPFEVMLGNLSQLRNAPTLNRFKQANKNHTIKPPKFYIAGYRILNIIHTRLRHRSSSLNADLFRVHLANGPACICGCAFEDAIHYILECCLYNEAREELKLMNLKLKSYFLAMTP